MAIFEHSRYRYAESQQDDDDKWFLTDREPYEYKDISDNVIHIAKGDETWEHIAGQYYHNFPTGCLLYWILIDFQPDENPVIDPTLTIPAGKEIYIPSERTVRNVIFNDERRRYT